MPPLQETHSWTLGGLIGAFIDLVLAYFLLCGSAIAFFASKLFRFFGLYLPCPCKAMDSSLLCVHKILFEWPSRKICSIQVMAAKRFPFDLVRNAEENHRKSDRSVELEDEASCSSCSGRRLLALDAKGKRKRRIRRRRPATYDSGKLLSVISSDNQESDAVALNSCLPFHGRKLRDKTSDSMNRAFAKQVSLLDVEDSQTGQDLDVKTCHSYEFNGSMVDSPGQDKYSSSYENYTSNVLDNVQILGNGADRIKMLENALKEEKAAYAALYLELEKERAAAATAADEAMAMISRLQEEKASMEMDMRQYQRMIEERVVYEEEEMNILQEILIRRERENHFLEKELEAYRQMGLGGRDQSNGKPRALPDEWEQRLPTSHETHEDPPQIESPLSVKKEELSLMSSNYMVAQTCIGAEDREEQAKNTEHKGQAQDNVHISFYDAEPDVLDFHVIDDNIELKDEENKKISSSSFSTVSNEPRDSNLEFGSPPVCNRNVVSSRTRTRKTGSDTIVDGPISQLCTADSRCKALPSGSRKGSSRADNNEKLKINAEIGIPGERLKMIQHEREKLSLFAENDENEKGQLKLLEEIANHLLQTKRLRNPVRGASLPPSPRNHVRGASLPPPSDKVSLRERRCQSACESS